MKLKYVKTFLDIASNFAELSHCERLKVGAAIVSEKSESIFGGYNGRPRGEPNIGEVDGVTHPDVQHAEENALKKIMRSNESSVGASLFVTHSPCRGCAIDIVDAGLKAVYFLEKYRDSDGIYYLLKHGVYVFQYDAKAKSLYQVKSRSGDFLEYIYC